MDQKIPKNTPTLFQECIQCGLTAKEASTDNYSSDYKRKNLVYATAIHSLSCGPGPQHNDECAICCQKMSSFKAYQEHVEDLFIEKEKDLSNSTLIKLKWVSRLSSK